MSTASPRPRGRLRSPVRPAHRAPGPRGEGLLRDRAALDAGRRDAGEEPGRDHPLRRPVQRLRAGRAADRRRRCSTPTCRSSASATASRRWPRRSAARSRGPATASTAAPRCAAAARARACCSRDLPARPAGLDEPRRLRDRGPGGLHGHRRVGGRAGRRLRGPGRPPGRRAVPPGGRAHRARPGDADPLPVRHRRHRADLDAGEHHRRAGRRGSARRSATSRSSAACPAAWTRRSPPRWCTRPSATSSPASSSTTACCARARPSRSRRTTSPPPASS